MFSFLPNAYADSKIRHHAVIWRHFAIFDIDFRKRTKIYVNNADIE